jgi:integrase
LADVLILLADCPTISDQVRRNLASSIATFSRVVDREPRFIPVEPAALRRAFSEALPGVVGLSMGRWRNVKSEVRRAIKLSGLVGHEVKKPEPLPQNWEQVALYGPTPQIRWILRNFGRFCAARAITPEVVDDVTISAYADYRSATALAGSPEVGVGDLIRCWNRHVAVHPEGPFRAFTVKSKSTVYTMSWDAFPVSLKADVASFHQASLDPDIFDVDSPKPVRQTTIDARDRCLRRLASAEVLRGVPIESLKTLADVVSPATLKQGLHFIQSRKDNGPTVQMSLIAELALTVARHWAHLPEADVNEIRRIAKKLKRKRGGLTDKNSARLRPFSNDATLVALLELPWKMAKRALKAPASARSALELQSAVAVALFPVAPLRLGNVVNLDRHRHFVASSRAGGLNIVIPAAEVKNSQNLEFPLSAEHVDLIDTYMRKYQPLLCQGRMSSLLFPGRGAGPKTDNSFRRQIAKTIKAELGLAMNPHLFRHLVALVYLRAHPGSYEDVRRVLGHKSLTTTMQNYVGLETTAAVARFDEVIQGLRRAGSKKVPS